MFELTFVGASPDEHRKIEKWFLEEAKTLTRNELTIRGFCDSEEMEKMFRETDLIVMPSRTEGFGLVALEAISAGVPVLVSSECGIAESIGGSGWWDVCGCGFRFARGLGEKNP